MLHALEAQQRELAELLAAATDAELLRPTRCPGWSVADVLLHLAQTNEMAVASATDRLDEFFVDQAGDLEPGGTIDDLAGALVTAQRGEPAASLGRWEASVEAQRRALAACDPGARLRWVAGELAARTLATTRLTEAWIHTGDVAFAFGELPGPTDRLWHTARLAWRTLPYAFERAGQPPPAPVAFSLVAPDGSTWRFGPDDAATTLTGTAIELCTVAGQRAAAADTGLRATGPDAHDVLRLVRTFA